MKSAEGCDALNLPEFNIEPPVAEKNFKYSPAESAEAELVDGVLAGFPEKKFSADDMLSTFIFRRVCPLQRRVHKMCHMSGRLDPTRLSRHLLTKEDVMKRVRAIAHSKITEDWEWNVTVFRRGHPAPVVNN